MRQETQKKVEDLGPVRMTLELVHYIAESEDEAHETVGWEVKQLTFVLHPDLEESERGSSSITLKDDSRTPMWVPRMWLAGFELHGILFMLNVSPGDLREQEMRLPFNAMLDKVPSYPFAD
jgi:hypothetical protein